jgi:hypothetical protein
LLKPLLHVVVFFCDKPATLGQLHRVTTYDVDTRVRNCAFVLQDFHLLAKLSASDLIAADAYYHSSCLVALYKRAAAATPNETSGNDSFNSAESLAFAQLVAYITEEKQDTSIAPVFKLSDLSKLYQYRLQQLDVSSDTRVHTTRLKNKLLSQFPAMTAQSHGKEILLAFNEEIGGALSNACQFDADIEAAVLVRAAQILRRDISKITNSFCGNFASDCQETSVPKSLTAFIQMILEGPNIDSHIDNSCVPAALSISQLIIFNSVKYTRKNTAAIPTDAAVRHNTSRETPLALYLALIIHAETRKRDLIDKFFHLGLCVSYDRVLSVSASLANRVCDCYDVSAGVFPHHCVEGAS